MSGTSMTGEVRDELISDRHIESAEEDRLRHALVAAELTALVRGVTSHANIALYGPWGSGKSGLARLLRTQLGESASTRFAIFDASKYAGESLRRHFISQLALQLKVAGKEFREGLYVEETSTSVSLPARDFGKTLSIFVAALAVASLVAVLVAFIVALFAVGPTGETFNRFVRYGLSFASAPAALIAAFIVLAGTTIPVQRRRSAPSSEEEFERLFRLLLQSTGAQQIVVFVDELDRCSPNDVVATLETIRTFLGVEGCVFIVAADQHVLEKALKTAAGQANPADTVNPYYSLGSEYLDKTFQYQMHLPPLLPRRLTRFAFDLTTGRGGLWDKIDRGEVLSVLLPTHVHSPRRVKALLNSFVLSYRLARQRLGDEVEARAAELAKLVCLRSEFPLFAGELERDVRLTDRVLAASRLDADAEGAEGKAELELAADFASGDAPADEILLADTPERAAVARAHADQLVAYLSKTEHVVIGRDLVHLESLGAAVGISGDLAEDLEDAAVNGQVDVIVRRVSALSEAEQLASLRHLAQISREADLGVEGRNSVSALLGAADAVPNLDLGTTANELVAAVRSHLTQQQLATEDLSGAFLLATRSTVGGDDLVTDVLSRPEARHDERLAHAITSRLRDCLTEHEESVAEVVAAAATRGDDGLVERLAVLDDSPLSSLVRCVGDQLPLAASQSEEPPGGEEEQSAWGESLDCLSRLAGTLVSTRRYACAEVVLAVLATRDDTEARSKAIEVLATLPQVQNPELVEAMITAVRPRVTTEWPQWLEPLTPDQVVAIQASDQLDALAAVAWVRAVKTDKPDMPEATSEALDQLVRLGYAGGPDLAKNVGDSVASLDPAAYPNYETVLGALQIFAAAQVLELSAFAEQAADRLQALLAYPFGVQPAEAAPANVLLGQFKEIASVASPGARASLGSALANCTWLATSDRRACEIDLCVAMVAAGEQPVVAFSADELAGAAAAAPERLGRRFPAWIEHLATPADVCAVRDTPLLAEADVLKALARRCAAEPDWASETMRLVLERLPAEVPAAALIRALGSQTERAQEFALELVAKYEAVTNNSEREAILRAWEAGAPSENPARKRLVEEVLIPTAKSSKGGLEAVLRRLAIAAPAPHGTKERLRSELNAAGDTFGLSKQVRSAMERQGLVQAKRRFRPFG